MITLCILGYLFVAFLLSFTTYSEGDYDNRNPYYLEFGTPYWRRFLVGLKIPIICIFLIGLFIAFIGLVLWSLKTILLFLMWIGTHMP